VNGGRNTSEATSVEYHKRLPEAVKWIVDRQIELGVDVVNDGEYPKAGSFAGYVETRVTAETAPAPPDLRPKRAGVGARDTLAFPGAYAAGLWNQGSGGPIRPGFIEGRTLPPQGSGPQRVIVGPVRYIGESAAREDVANLKAAIAGKPVEGYIASLGPITYAGGRNNAYYPSEEQFLMAVAEALRQEYKIVTDAGLILQMDEPQFCTEWQFHPEYDLAALRKQLGFYVEVINHSLQGIPEELVRFHTCWGSGHRPHVYDIELKHIADLMVEINAKQYSVEAANVRHQHEYHVWEDVKLPDGKMLMPGVIAHATDLVEHPEMIAERLIKYAERVGRENVQTGTDCGIGSRVGHEEIAWAKLKAMSEGAAIASKKLWP
jgi:5-methyltetrahydropteroyltriglutamate--homocysteine methyltransferase